MQATLEKPAQINPKLIMPFVNSTRSVLTTMLNLQPTIGRPSIKANPCPEYDVSGIIGFSGDVVGTVVVSFHTDAAAKLVEAFAGMPMAPGSSDFADALGELTNMIAGGAKKELGQAANMSTPTVVMGKGHIIARPSGVPCLVIPCDTPLGAFAVELSIKTGV